MDFFESQEQARKRTGRLVVLFGLAVIAIAVTLYALAVAVTGYAGQDPHTGAAIWQPRWIDPELMVQVALATLLVVGGASLFKIAQLRAGGGRIVAESLGGRLLQPNSGDAVERRILNVVEEIAIAAGTQVPPVYLLDAEAGTLGQGVQAVAVAKRIDHFPRRSGSCAEMPVEHGREGGADRRLGLPNAKSEPAAGLQHARHLGHRAGLVRHEL